MHPPSRLAVVLVVAASLASAGVFAADNPANKPADPVDTNLAKLGPKARIFAKYDTNKNGVIDGDEVAAVRKAYAADPKGEFAKYDTNHDGKLSDEEIAAIKPPGGGGKSGAAKKATAQQDVVAPAKTDAN